ncbi:MAG: transcription initiation factor TFIIIB Brf1 subunit/transcription initiation factor TFIIB [Halobacteriales archaeon]|jgi:transcription initiation factor TFIIIB Brf1 subunit/transcription initiation factor TFIIB
MYRASEGIENEEWLAELEAIANRLDLDPDARSAARELFLTNVPEQGRSKRPALAASVYAGSLVAGDRRSQTVVADAADVSRLSIQQRWKDLLSAAGLEPPTW